MNRKKRFYTKNSVIATIIALGIAVISLFGFALPAIRDMQQYDDAMNTLEETLYDYRLYYPLQTQLEELSKLDSVKSIFPYYQYDADVSYNQKTYHTNAIFSDDSTNLGISEYNEKRLLSGSMALNENYILLDRTCAEELGVKCGDIVNIKLNRTSEIPVTVAGIFKDNSFFKEGSVYLDYSGNTKEKIDESYEKLRLSGALVKENNSTCWDDIKSYVPMGEMLTEDYFSSGREYEEYVESFMAEDHSSKIYNKKELQNSMQSLNQKYVENADRKILQGSLFYGAAFVFMFIQSAAAKKFVEQFARNNNSQIATGELIKKYVEKDFVSAVFGIAVFLLIFTFLIQKYNVLNDFQNKVILYFGLAAFISLLILIVIDIFVVKRIVHKGNKYRQ